MKLFRSLNLKQSLLALSVLLFASTAQAISTDETMILRTPDGTRHTIEDYTKDGKWTLVVFWVSDCHVCNVESQQYSNLHDRRKNKDIKVLGVSLDGLANLDDARSFIKRNKVTFPNLIGENAQVSRYFAQHSGMSLQGTPAIFLYDAEGILVAAEIGAVPVSVIEDYVAKNQIAAR